jgi:hypothetical protein
MKRRTLVTLSVIFALTVAPAAAGAHDLLTKTI